MSTRKVNMDEDAARRDEDAVDDEDENDMKTNILAFF